MQHPRDRSVGLASGYAQHTHRSYGSDVTGIIRARVLTVLSTGVLAACTNLSDYAGDYQGSIVGTDDSSCSEGNCSFIRRGFPAGTTLSLRFDAMGPESSRTLSTSDGSFQDTPLKPIAPVEHDFLSQLELPGAGRIKTLIYAATPREGPLSSRDPLVFVSLMDEQKIEVRILVGAGDYFGLFRLTQQ